LVAFSLGRKRLLRKPLMSQACPRRRSRRDVQWGGVIPQAWMHIYDGAKELPGDLEEMFRHIKLSKRMFRDEMALEILSIMGKYGPWKTALLQSYNMLAGSRSRVRGGRLKVAKSSRLGQRATFIRQVCLGALAACANRAEEFDPWVANVGMNMTFCSGSGRTTNVPLQVINR